METITSRRNPLAARFRRAARRDAGADATVLLEGPRLVEDALAAGLRLEVAAVSTSPAPRGAAPARRLDPVARVVRVPSAVMEALSPAATPSGLVALAALRPALVEDVMRASPPLVVGLSGVQDPGNTGAVIRAVEAGGASGVVTVGGADPLGWKALRGAMGSAFRVPVARAEDPAAVRRLASAHGLRVVAAAPPGGTPLTEVDLSGPCLVWLGAEGAGLDRDAAATADGTVTIPMRRPVESLNIAVAAAIIVYEAARQRSGAAGPDAPPAGHGPGSA
ncbi:MAG: RNA methyltransferase [Acidobacteria bacterium]|nr:RNA methyltransferase [Acidobacteriota bacterium]